MRKGIIVLVVLLGCSHTLFSQIKIGDNPQAIDPSSVLELESTDRVFVVTRINTEQMNAIVPASGAMVYNIDENCIFYFNGTEWLNLCASLGLSLSAEAIANDFPTIILTEIGAQTNIEVGEIHGSNIVDFSISAADIQNNSITADKLAPDSVGVEELQDNTVSDNEINYNEVTIADFTNDIGYITTAEVVSANAGNDIVDNGGAFYDDGGLQNDIAANTAAIAADEDTDPSNELQTLTISGNQLDIAGGNTVDLGFLDNEGTDDQNLTGAVLSGNVLTLNIENGNPASVDLSALSGTGTDDQNLSLSGNVISIEDGNNIDLTPILVSGGTDDQNLSLAGNIITIEGGNSIDLTPILDSAGTDDQQLSLSGNTLILEDGGTVDLTPYLDNSDDQNLTGASLNAANELTIDIEDGNSVTVDLSSLAGAGTDDQVAAEVPFTPSGNTASLDVQAAIEELQTEIDGISAGGAANPTDELITSFALNGTGLDIAEGANILPTVDLDVTFATDAELATLPIDDADPDPTNELQTISSPDATLTINQVGNDYELTVTGGNSDDQNIQGSSLAGESLTIGIEGGTSENVDLSSFATETELTTAIAASEALDLDTDPANEIQNISSPDASVNVNQVGNDYELTVTAGGTDTTLADTNLTQTAGQDRTYDLNNQNLAFIGSGNFGIGTTGNPTNKLHVEGAIRSEGGILSSDGVVNEPAYRFTSDTDTGMYRAAANQLAFSAGSSEAMRISNPGNTRVTITDELELNQELLDKDAEAGTSGQILSSTGTGVDWIDAPSTSPVIAMGKVDAAAIAERVNSAVSDVDNTATGIYQVFLAAPRPTNEYIIQLSLFNAGAGYSIEVVSQSINSFDVQIYDDTNSLANASWYFTVLDF